MMRRFASTQPMLDARHAVAERPTLVVYVTAADQTSHALPFFSDHHGPGHVHPLRAK